MLTRAPRAMSNYKPSVYAKYETLLAERDAARILVKGYAKIIDEQARLLTYVYKYFNGNILLSDGWMEDCREILGLDR
jgi:hypothetical protein